MLPRLHGGRKREGRQHVFHEPALTPDEKRQHPTPSVEPLRNGLDSLQLEVRDGGPGKRRERGTVAEFHQVVDEHVDLPIIGRHIAHTAVGAFRLGARVRPTAPGIALLACAAHAQLVQLPHVIARNTLRLGLVAFDPLERLDAAERLVRSLDGDERASVKHFAQVHLLLARGRLPHFAGEFQVQQLHEIGLYPVTAHRGHSLHPIQNPDERRAVRVRARHLVHADERDFGIRLGGQRLPSKRKRTVRNGVRHIRARTRA